jgi:acetyltransferase-like isoleucine patch superfamily enzyme
MPPLTKEALPQYKIGQCTYGVPEVITFGDDATLEIGSFCSIAKGVKIFLGGEHRSDWVTTYPFYRLWPGAPKFDVSTSKGPVSIGSDVWIGTDVKIMSGVTVGHGAVIGAGSIVVQDVPPYAVVFGNPAKVIRFRFDLDTITALLEIAWWNWPDQKITDNLPLLLSGKVEEFIVQDFVATRTSPYHGEG